MKRADYYQGKFFNPKRHPYRQYENYIFSILNQSMTILDAGCGRTAPILKKFIGAAKNLIGVDLEECTTEDSDIKYIQGDISNIDIPDNSVDVVISRAVLEHVKEPGKVFTEITRVLKPGGQFIFLVPNQYDYASLASILIPNKFHKKIVQKTEGRSMEDVFPAYYKANSYSSIRRFCDHNRLKIISFKYIGQYPAYFKFNTFLFLLATLYEKILDKVEFLKYFRGWILVHVEKS